MCSCPCEWISVCGSKCSLRAAVQNTDETETKRSHWNKFLKIIMKMGEKNDRKSTTEKRRNTRCRWSSKRTADRPTNGNQIEWNLALFSKEKIVCHFIRSHSNRYISIPIHCAATAPSGDYGRFRHGERIQANCDVCGVAADGPPPCVCVRRTMLGFNLKIHSFEWLDYHRVEYGIQTSSLLHSMVFFFCCD